MTPSAHGFDSSPGYGESPGGIRIRKLTGEPAPIIQRGNQIERFGVRMATAADTLRDLADGKTELRGKAMDRLKEQIGDTHSRLREAARLYKPVGPIIRTYGRALSGVKADLNASVTKWYELDTTYRSLPGKVEARGTDGFFDPDPGSEEAEREAKEDAAKKAAFDAREAEGHKFDGFYNTWETAFDTAARGVRDKLDGKVKDGRWEKVAGWVDSAAKWVTDNYDKIAMAVLVIVLVLNPASLGVVLIGAAALNLGARLWQKSRGDATWKQVGVAAFDIVPFGKAGKLGTAAYRSVKTTKNSAIPLATYKRLSRGDKNLLKNYMVSGWLDAAKPLASLGRDVNKGMFRMKPYQDGLQQVRDVSRAFMDGKGGGRVTDTLKKLWQTSNEHGVKDVATRLTTGKSIRELGEMFKEGADGAKLFEDSVELLHSMTKNGLSIGDAMGKLNDDPKMADRAPSWMIGTGLVGAPSGWDEAPQRAR